MKNNNWLLSFKIDSRAKISNKDKTFIIAEIGSNHNQSLKKAFKLISIAAKAGADAVKFQFLNYEQMYKHDRQFSQEKKLFKKIKFNQKWIDLLVEECKKLKIIFFFSITSLESQKIAEEKKMKLIKIASPQFYGNPWLCKRSLDSNIPTIISTGLSSLEEIKRNMKNLRKSNNKKLVLLYCVSQYPLDYDNLKLDQIKKFKTFFKCLVGFSDHSRSTLIPAIAVEKGACVIEKHITINRKDKGPDHFFSLEPSEFKTMVANIREIDLLKKSKKKIYLDKKLLKLFKIKCIAPKNFTKNERISNLKLHGLRASKGIDIEKAEYIENNFLAKKFIKKGEILSKSNIIRKK